MIKEVEGSQNLGTLNCMREGIYVCVMVVVLMIVVGVVVMMLVVGVLCLREVEVDGLRVVCFMVEGDIFELGGGFMTIVVAVEVENLEGRVVSLVL